MSYFLVNNPANVFAAIAINVRQTIYADLNVSLIAAGTFIVGGCNVVHKSS